jgi:hypothetical protein
MMHPWNQNGAGVPGSRLEFEYGKCVLYSMLHAHATVIDTVSIDKLILIPRWYVILYFSPSSYTLLYSIRKKQGYLAMETFVPPSSPRTLWLRWMLYLVILLPKVIAKMVG